MNLIENKEKSLKGGEGRKECGNYIIISKLKIIKDSYI